MAESDEINAAERRGYSRGYTAGRKYVTQITTAEMRRKQDQAFLDRAFLAALPACIRAEGWTRGEKKIISLDDRVALAADFAKEALKRRPRT